MYVNTLNITPFATKNYLQKMCEHSTFARLCNIYIGLQATYLSTHFWGNEYNIKTQTYSVIYWRLISLQKSERELLLDI